MSYGSATASAPFELPSVGLARAVAAAIPMLLLAYPALIWPLLYAEPVRDRDVQLLCTGR